MATVTISGTNYTTCYISVADADTYANGSVSEGAVAYRAGTTDEKGRWLLTATRMLDRQQWAGDDIEANAPNKWGRTGIADVDDDTVPQQVLDATVELAMALAGGSLAESALNTGAQQKRVKAGTAEVENFRTRSAELRRFPLPVHELIGKWLKSSSGSSLAGKSFGVDRESPREDTGFNDGI